MKQIRKKLSTLAVAAAVLTSSMSIQQQFSSISTNAAETKYIALTFDDGPNTTTTEDVLDVLEENNVTASFFLVGANINEKSAKTVKRAYDMGCEIDNHSKSHADMSEMSITEIKAEIEYVNDWVYKITGEYPSFFRPPYIAVSETMYQTIDMPFISGVGCDDWDSTVSSQERAETVISAAHDGQIILMHDAAGNSKTVEALKTIIPTLKNDGYEFVTVNELFEKQGITPTGDVIYSSVGDSSSVKNSPSKNSSNGVNYAEYNIPDLNITKKTLPDNEAINFIRDMRLGWNLGNTFDAYDDTGWVNGEMNIETCWNGGIKTTKEMIDTVKSAGFRTVRIPVSWHNHVDEDLNISKQWMDRVQEVVDYAIDEDLYVIINVHHDNSEDTMYPDSEHYSSSKKYMTAIWEQVSERFKDYDNKLIFETMNEPRLTGHTNEWWLDLTDADCVDAVKTINKLNQDCVDVIRSSGGNNADRYIAVPGYDCSVDGATNQYFEMPKDNAENKIIVAVHAYVPYGFALAEEYDPQSVDEFDINTDTSDIEWVMDSVYSKYISKGIPAYIGEFAALNKNGNIQSRVDWTSYYTAYAASRGLTCCWWDAVGDMMLLERNTCTWEYPQIVAALNKYADGDVDVSIVTTTPQTPQVTTTTTTTVITENDKLYGKKSTDGTVSFGQSIGETVYVDIKLDENTGFLNGCLGFSPYIDGKSYWVSYLIETKKSGTLTIDMNQPFQVMEVIGTDSENVKDEAVIETIVEKLKKEKSTLLQTWYASDIKGKQIDPPDSAVESIDVYILTSTESKSADGDVNADGSLTVADLVLLQKWILAVPDVKLSDWKAADLCEDDRLDVFDLVRLRQLLLAA